MSALSSIVAATAIAGALYGTKEYLDTPNKQAANKVKKAEEAKEKEETRALLEAPANEARERAESEKTQAGLIATRDQQRRRQRSMASGARSAFLTGPLGVPGGGSPGAGRKTLLGQ